MTMFVIGWANLSSALINIQGKSKTCNYCEKGVETLNCKQVQKQTDEDDDGDAENPEQRNHLSKVL